MSGFGYLVTLVSVVAGLGLTHSLFGLAKLVHARKEIRFSGVHLAWTGSVLLWLIYYWWFTYLLIDVEGWTPPLLVFVLAYGAVIYFLIALLYPDQWGSSRDLFDYFIDNRQWFFGAFVGLGVFDIVDTLIKVIVYDLQPPPLVPYVFLMALWLVLGSVAAVTSNRLYHRTLALLWLIVSVSWIVSSPSVIGG